MSTEGDDEVRSVIGAMGAMLYKFVRETHRVIKTFSAALGKKCCTFISRHTLGCVAFLRFGDNFNDVTYPL